MRNGRRWKGVKKKKKYFAAVHTPSTVCHTYVSFFFFLPLTYSLLCPYIKPHNPASPPNRTHAHFKYTPGLWQGVPVEDVVGIKAVSVIGGMEVQGTIR